MSDLLDPEALQYFFGPLFDVDVALTAARGHKGAKALEGELSQSIEQGRPHLGIQLIGYHDVDTGLSTVCLMHNPGVISSVSFFAQSSHRFFGGTTLVCVPLPFCSPRYMPSGNYTVYRHTYKRPRFNDTEMESVLRTATPEQKLKAFLFAKCREGYETIPGMSYVGVTSRAWQERYLEHTERALEASSSTHFHQAIRAMQGQLVVCVHDVSAYGLSEKDAKAYESKLIAQSTLYPLGLNMKL